MEKKTAIFGGSFNPVHKAHADIIKNLSKRFDRVVVVPCFISPFKKKETLAQGNVRIEMLSACTDKLSNVEISEYELQKGETSYSLDTANYLANKYPDEKLYFVIGSDGIKGLTRWYNIEELKSIVTFYAIARPNFAIDNKKISSLAKRGINVEIADFDGEDGSSSEAKAALAFGQAKKILPEAVIKIAEKNELYSDYAALVAALKENNLSDERIEHTYNAVKAGIVLAKRFNADVNKTITALILHDIGKHGLLSEKEESEMAEELNNVPEKVRHAFIGAYIVKNRLKIKGNDIVTAIKTHTCGDEKMSKLQKIVYLADIIEQSRTFDGIENLREMCKVNLNKAMELALELSLAHLIETDSEIYYKTERAYDYFAALNAPKAKKEKVNAPIFGIVKEQQIAQPQKKDSEPKSPKELAELIADYLDQKKARDINIIDISEKTIIADFFVIASVTSTTAVKALSDYVDEKLSKQFGIEPLRRDRDSKWMAVDYGSVILHVMHEETREFYNLERLWQNGANSKKLK